MTETKMEDFKKAAEQIEADQLDKILEEVTSWLGRLVLLYGVPFHYLLPDEEMLPTESVRFFYLDPIWIQCMVQGACSIGSNGYGDSIVDQVMNKWVQPNQPDGSENGTRTQSKVANVRDRLRQQWEGTDPPTENENIEWPLTGFLLRSTLVDGWRGMEVMAYRNISKEERKTWNRQGMNEEQIDKLEKECVVPMKALRIEQLSQDAMLGIFNGKIDQLVIRQPQEGLHFGVTPGIESDPTAYTKRLRNFGFKNPEDAGEAIQHTSELGEDAGTAIPLTIELGKEGFIRNSQPQKGVIKIGALANSMKQSLSKLDLLKEGKFTSAEFAVQMIESPGEFTFKPDHKNQL